MVSALLSIICTIVIFFSLSPPVNGTIIDFNDYPVGTQITDQYTSYGVTFAPGGEIVKPDFSDPNKVSLSIDGNLEATFTGVSVHSVSVEYFSVDPLTLEAKDSSNKIHYAYASTLGMWSSFGLSLYENIVNVRIYDGGGRFAIDNFAFLSVYTPASVPEASTWILLASCLIGMFYVKRKASIRNGISE